MKITVLLADDHAMMRAGLRSLLANESDVQVVGEASNGRETLELVARHKPSVVVMDIGMPDLNGIEATRQICANESAVRIVALSTYSDKRYVLAMLEAGAAGYVLKASVANELLHAIRAAAAGKKYLSPEIAGVVVDSYVARQFPTENSAAQVLGAREREVLQLLAEGKTSAQIAERLFISLSTVDAHRRNIMKKLNLHSVAELTKYAIREGLTSVDS